MFQLPISEYPEVVPPSVVVRAQYPGANPKVIAETVATRSRSRSTASRTCCTCPRRPPDGTLTLTVTFKLGTDLEHGRRQLVQNRVSQALPRLPEEVRAARRHHDQELARPDDGGAPDFARRPLRQAVPAQLRDAATSRTSWRASTASAMCSCSARRLRHARLARPAEGRRARPDRRRRRQRHPRAERAGRGRRGRRRRPCDQAPSSS